jgi:hypothetical protein
MKSDFIVNWDRIEIPLSKVKIVFLLVIGIGFVMGGIFFVMYPEQFQNSFSYRPKWEISTLGYICIIFFGACIVIAILKLFDNKPGLLIDNQGITINPGSSGNSFVEWGNIEKFSIIDISRTKLIQVYLKEPNDFIDKLTNVFKRKLALFSLKTYGTPVSISAGTLKCNTAELYQLLIDKLKANK